MQNAFSLPLSLAGPPTPGALINGALGIGKEAHLKITLMLKGSIYLAHNNAFHMLSSALNLLSFIIHHERSDKLSGGELSTNVTVYCS